jgi:hypothetical protein
VALAPVPAVRHSLVTTTRLWAEMPAGSQSPSSSDVQPAGQQPSGAATQAVTGRFSQVRSQPSADPDATSVVQASPSSQPAAQGSHSSGGSSTPLPQSLAQSSSSSAVAPLGQHPSPFLGAVMGVFRHLPVHLPAWPVSRSAVHTLLSLQLVGQLLGGSQVSPGSTVLLPQTALQSASVVFTQPMGQHPSGSPPHSVTVLGVQTKSQPSALPVIV